MNHEDNVYAESDSMLCAFSHDTYGMVHHQHIAVLHGPSDFDMGLYGVTLRDDTRVFVRTGELSRFLFGAR